NVERVLIKNQYCNSHPTIDKSFQELMTVKIKNITSSFLSRILMSLHWMNSELCWAALEKPRHERFCMGTI
ncbi:hypothetical protein, partial [Pelotomaculum sp. PtaB.Bin117]|uniref:hypothetical protein n=1 Tax=Pelotomaculum sp. PtaB.Bin117 TaxID=1811694 RepID=UPI00257B9A21